MIIPEAFKYASIVSVPLFAAVAFLLIRTEQKFSLRTHTISKSVNYLHHPFKNIIFRLNFIVKAVLDLGFSLYVLQTAGVSFGSFPGIMLILSAILFGSLAYFTEGNLPSLHRIFVYTSGLFWAIGQMLAVREMGNPPFIILTEAVIFIPIIIGMAFVKRSNAFVQIVCVSIWYSWLVAFVWGYH